MGSAQKVGEEMGERDEETIVALKRRIAELEADLERARNHNIQLLRRKPRRGCIQGP